MSVLFTTTESNNGSALAHRLAKDAKAVDVAKAIVAVWRDVDGALRPIIGQRGVAALFDRSVHLTAAIHPWLVPSHRDSEAELDLSALESLLSQQTVAAALSGGNDLLLTFHRLLASLIGLSLTERLLWSAWRPPLGAMPTQDPSP